jgi:carbamoyl-phosphate synthase large subunit
MKAVRGAEIGLDTLNNKALNNVDIKEKLHSQDDLRLFTVFKALKEGITVEEIHEITMIDEWFLYKLKNLAEYEKQIENSPLSKEM